MSFPTKIEYAHGTFSPWYGCSKVSPGCEHCFAESWAKRTGMVEWGPGKARRRASQSAWNAPLRWNKAAFSFGIRYRILTDLCDPFDSEVDVTWKDEYFTLIKNTPLLDWMVLTKRPNAASRWASEWRTPLSKNVWLGVSVCNQEEADEKIPALLSIPATKHWVSIEPMLGPVSLFVPMSDPRLHGTPYKYPDWIVCGGETGHGARPMHPDWVRSIRDQCVNAGVPWFFKSWGEWLPAVQATDEQLEALGRCHIDYLWPNGIRSWRVGHKSSGHLLDGKEWRQMP